MESLFLENENISIQFIKGFSSLSWNDLYYGYINKWIDYTTIIDYAIHIINENSNDIELNLASLQKDRASLWEFEDNLKYLSDEENKRGVNHNKTRWLVIAISWLYYNKEKFKDPLGKIEELYADFDYPEEMESFVRYMPNSNPGIKTLYDNWRIFVEKYSRVDSE